MSEMLERAGRAVCIASGREPENWLNPHDRELCIRIATAVVRALREPHTSTVINGLMALVEKISETSSPLEPVEDGQILTEEQAANRYMNIGAVMRNGREVEATWQAMIDSILSTQPQEER